MKTDVVSVRLDTNTRTDRDAIAEAYRMTRPEFIRQAVQKELRRCVTI